MACALFGGYSCHVLTAEVPRSLTFRWVGFQYFPPWYRFSILCNPARGHETTSGNRLHFIIVQHPQHIYHTGYAHILSIDGIYVIEGHFFLQMIYNYISLKIYWYCDTVMILNSPSYFVFKPLANTFSLFIQTLIYLFMTNCYFMN